MKHHINQIHQSIYRHMRKKAAAYNQKMSPALRQYYREHTKSASRPFTVSSLSELLDSIKKSRVVYLGDFHTFDQSSKNVERLLRTLVKQTKQLILGIEFVHRDKQHVIDAYLQHRITETEFLEQVDYPVSWQFPWNQYRFFFAMAQTNNLRIIALNSKGSLSQRDQYAAQIIAKELLPHPKCKMLILFGEYHILPSKLPARVTKLMANSIKQTIIHQNLDSVFWRLHDTNEQIIKFDPFEFSLQTSPPWIKYESMIYWFENLYNDSDFDIHEYIRQIEHKTLSGNAQDDFLYLCKKILRAFHLEITSEQLENFNLYDYSNLSFVVKEISKIKSLPFERHLKQLINAGKTIKIPFKGSYYCSNYSLNRLSFLAGAHIYYLLVPEAEFALTKRDQTNKFLFFLLQCFLSYLAAKTINPYLKCDHYQDILRLYQITSNSKKKYLALCLKIFERNDRLCTLLKGHSLSRLYAAAKLIGNCIADEFFNKFMNSPHFGRLLERIAQNDFTEHELFSLLDLTLPFPDFKNQKKRFF